MGIISEIKCARCDRKYSGVRSRCPYCGARRIGRGKYTEEADNSKGKMLIGILVMSVLVVAAGVLLLATPRPTGPGNGLAASSPSPSMRDDEDVTSVTGIKPVTPSPTDESPDIDETSPPPSIQVMAVAITYSGRVKTDISVKVGERVPLKVRIDPMGVDEEVLWYSSDTSIFGVVPDSLERTQAIVTGVGLGNATLTVTVGDIETTCIVRGTRGS